MKWYIILFLFCTFAHGTELDALYKASIRTNVPYEFLLAICMVESNLDAKIIGDGHQPEPSVGLCQIKPSTAKIYGAKGTVKELKNPYNNAFYAASHLYKLLNKHDGNWDYAAAEYNFGTLKLNPKGKIWNRGYVKKVNSMLEYIRKVDFDVK